MALATDIAVATIADLKRDLAERDRAANRAKRELLGVCVLAATAGLFAGVAFVCWTLLLIYPALLTTACAALGVWFWRKEQQEWGTK